MSKPEDHLDIVALKELKDIMEEEFDTLVATFIRDSSNKVEELADIIEAGDPDRLRKVAHSLKGSSSNVCAMPLSELARQLEQLGREGTLAGAADLLERLRDEFQQVATLLNNNI